jgi:tRNA threonylcarbamoyladenosine biosynthesis protein TsaB
MSDRPVLALDASTYAGSVAVVVGARVLAEATTAMRGEREERLMPAVGATLAEAGVAPGDLGGIVCGSGPGSFTSLRIAASIAKGLASATGAPLLAVPSHLLIVAGAPVPLAAGRYLTVLDAMRGEVFALAVELPEGSEVAPRGPLEIVPASEVDELARRVGARVAGPHRALDLAPHARGVARLAATLARGRPVDLAAWEPTYGRVAEAQARWEREHGRALPAS